MHRYLLLALAIFILVGTSMSTDPNQDRLPDCLDMLLPHPSEVETHVTQPWAATRIFHRGAVTFNTTAMIVERACTFTISTFSITQHIVDLIIRAPYASYVNALSNALNNISSAFGVFRAAIGVFEYSLMAVTDERTAQAVVILIYALCSWAIIQILYILAWVLFRVLGLCAFFVKVPILLACIFGQTIINLARSVYSSHD